MGGSSSTRRVEFHDPMISITNDVADRIEKALDSPDKPSKRKLESEDDLTDLYHNKIKELEEKNAKLLNARVDEFAQAVQEVEKKFMNSTGSPVCQDLQDKVFRCYTENHKKTLLCSPDVRAFFECVERARANALMRKG
ncbi:MICOS complex subunit MIC19-like isoform X2 [Ostrea edulis]|uniref:MICOS complex subunit MIC19-like isoform X2 n=1 Tax=Ostrea edulis TaxID=37623 RepID=UPI0020957D0F|nr:MICOS complex subunit MIC19-like isoform X2 [Ostrea edulis]